MQSFMVPVSWTTITVLFLCTVAVYGASECPDGGWLFRNRCYWLVREPTRSWQDANLYCTKIGTDMQLVIIPDEATNNFLVKKLSAVHPSVSSYVWIGLHDIAIETEWRWVDGTPLNYTNWNRAPSTSSYRNCAYLRMFNDENRGKWDQDQCQYNAAFVCSETHKQSLCPNGGTLFRDRCFWLGSKGTLPMHEADKACQEEFGKEVRLPVIRDAEMNAFVNRIMPSSWLGLSDVENEGEFKWIDGTPVTYDNWAYMEPNNRDGEDCALTTTSGGNRWTDVSCILDHRYICAVPTCYQGSDPNMDFNCSVSCSSCTEDSMCFHNGECRCIPEFDGMTCDKGNFSMSLHAPKTASLGDNVDLVCKTNLPIREVQFEWIKTATDGMKTSTAGTILPKKGASKLSITNMTSNDEASYFCIVTYMIGQISQLEMRSVYLEISNSGSTASQGKSASTTTGLAVAIAVLTIACVVLLIGIIFIVVTSRSSQANHAHVKMSQVLVE